VDDNENGTDWGAMLAGAVIGFAVGGTLGILLAPKSGAETRADLNQRLDDLREKAEGTLDRLQEATADLRGNLQEAVSAGKDAYAAKREELMSQFDAA
jgi:gas vesicle protein